MDYRSRDDCRRRQQYRRGKSFTAWYEIRLPRAVIRAIAANDNQAWAHLARPSRSHLNAGIIDSANNSSVDGTESVKKIMKVMISILTRLSSCSTSCTRVVPSKNSIASAI